MMIATRFLKNAFWKTGMSPARLMNNAMHAKANDDKRRYTIPLFLGVSLFKNPIVTTFLFSESSATKIKHACAIVYKKGLVQFID